jgi:hypothetical protein
MFRSATIAVTSSVVSLVMRAFAPRLAVAGGEVTFSAPTGRTPRAPLQRG